MSDTNELDRLRADLATLKAAFEIYDRDYKGTDRPSVIGIIESRIAKLEAEADPWAKTKKVVNHWLHQPPTPDAGWVARLVLHLEADNAKQSARIAEQNEWLEEWDKVAWKILPCFAAPPNPSHVDKRVEELKSLVVEFQQNAESERSEKNGLLIETALKRDEIAGLRRIIAELEARPIPPLDPLTTVATACKWMASQGDKVWAGYIVEHYQAGNAGIYPLAGDEPT